MIEPKSAHGKLRDLNRTILTKQNKYVHSVSSSYQGQPYQVSVEACRTRYKMRDMAGKFSFFIGIAEIGACV